jgi:hypothetical protein
MTAFAGWLEHFDFAQRRLRETIVASLHYSITPLPLDWTTFPDCDKSKSSSGTVLFSLEACRGQQSTFSAAF